MPETVRTSQVQARNCTTPQCFTIVVNSLAGTAPKAGGIHGVHVSLAIAADRQQLSWHTQPPQALVRTI